MTRTRAVVRQSQIWDKVEDGATDTDVHRISPLRPEILPNTRARMRGKQLEIAIKAAGELQWQKLKTRTLMIVALKSRHRLQLWVAGCASRSRTVSTRTSGAISLS